MHWCASFAIADHDLVHLPHNFVQGAYSTPVHQGNDWDHRVSESGKHGYHYSNQYVPLRLIQSSFTPL